MGNQSSANTNHPTTPSKNNAQYNNKLGSPARSPLSPPRRRQGGIQISPGGTRISQPRVALHEIDDNDFVVDQHNQVGEGSFAAVCMGRRISTGEQLAVKVINKKNVPEEMRHLIEDEFSLIRKLNHRNVISVEHAKEDDKNIYIFMPYFGGGDLHSFIDNYDYLAEKVAFKIFYQLVDAVDHCHLNDIIHRDIKLENMLMDNAKDMNITLIDFGFSVVRKPTDPLLDDFPGSPAYAAPELMQAIPYPGYSSDIWAMGVVLYICVTGEYPFWSDNRREMYEQIIKMPLDFTPYPYVSPLCRDLLEGMLNKDWRQRPTMDQIRTHPWFQKFKHLQKPVPQPQQHTEVVTPRGTGESEKAPKTPKTPKTPNTPRSMAAKWTPKMTWKKRKLVF
mmetsp:Transcript_25256/g.39417  ORF Transcript_25256/g.39417 Transcript_25256/m.39417 type:complete len:391 (-) Transcript_25256:178-1350(-)